MGKNKTSRRGSGHASGSGRRRGGSRNTKNRRFGAGPGLRAGAPVWIYGVHAAIGALGNPARNVLRLLLTEEVRDSMEERLAQAAQRNPAAAAPEIVARSDIEALLPRDSVHQGIAVEVEPLAEPSLDEICRDLPAEGAAIIVALDRVSDPRNVGAVVRAAAAFGALAVVVTERHAPATTGALAKAAAGAIERLPLVRVTNLARSLGTLKQAGFWCAGLDAGAEAAVGATDLPQRMVLILGAEGAGMRRLTRETCDYLLRIPIAPESESLNVATAAAVVLYALSRKTREDQTGSKDPL